MVFLGGSYFPMDPPSFPRPVVEAVPLTHLSYALRDTVNNGACRGAVVGGLPCVARPGSCRFLG